jgi:hypothetical protein
VLFNVSFPETIDSSNVAKLVKELHDIVVSELVQNEELVQTLKAEANGEIEKALNGLQESFKISNTTKVTCIDFFSDMDVEISEWISDINDSEKTKNILRLWFSLLKPYNQQEWT